MPWLSAFVKSLQVNLFVRLKNSSNVFPKPCFVSMATRNFPTPTGPRPRANSRRWPTQLLCVLRWKVCKQRPTTPTGVSNIWYEAAMNFVRVI